MVGCFRQKETRLEFLSLVRQPVLAECEQPALSAKVKK